MADKIDFAGIHNTAGYDSAFESDNEAERKRKRDEYNLIQKPKKQKGVPSHNDVEAEYSKEEGRIQRIHVLSMDAFAKHKKFINDYMMYYGGSKKDFKRDSSRDKRDIDVICENHQFLWEEEDEEADTWEKRLAKKYYDKLFKEYCITDLSRYKENKVAMRWRTETEVVDGKGQFLCGSRKCKESKDLRTWEVNFGYVEHGVKKNALVKLRLCPDCSYKLNYHHRKKEVIPRKRKQMETQETRDDTRKIQETQSESKDDRNSGNKDEAGRSVTEENSGNDSSIWKGPAKVSEDKSIEEEFDDYFEDMFL